MITIIDYKERKNAMDESFFALIITGGISMVQSKETGNYYATSNKASITSTFDEQTCKDLLNYCDPSGIALSSALHYSSMLIPNYYND